MRSSETVVLGAGLMGVGIATHFARHGHDVLLYDPDSQRLAEVAAVAGSILAELIEVGQLAAAEQATVLARLSVTDDLNDVARARLLIEAIPERLALKHALYEQLEGLIADDAVIASNTSGLPPDELAVRMIHPQRLLIAHFWNPPHLIPLVEIVPGSATDPRYLTAVQELLSSMALEAVLLDRAAPGFVGNRLQFALLPELATDDSMMALVESRLRQGNTGQRSGQGFYHWDEARRERIQQRRAHQLRFALKP
ncbi:3-hydroxyacyl-CoA dehydrogenase family protein [Serratia proteamaculans]|uniref:3-hydroxyacyl-CoA dehydrogenase family protein n=1 Tax=Serratia proteamaculans TaxID=28151 RepID=UPI00217B120B|nr:3-hydroxyacyl-CoA dehydrogenase family protein [Serratia proteamaculans]CAI1001259.1 3-hydroxybutyryl-CoA dehydrogenase [Serratia proteamaculans]CAI2136137.1 3-hydroxybutyryl-CoA dehydrogenase [Serratia proteamaculans]